MTLPVTNKFVSQEAYVKCISARRSKYHPYACYRRTLTY